jgi:hypothetical protein
MTIRELREELFKIEDQDAEIISFSGYGEGRRGHEYIIRTKDNSYNIGRIENRNLKSNRKEVPDYTIKGKTIPMTAGLNRRDLVKLIRENFSEEVANKVEQWNDMFEGRKFEESYIDKENHFIIMSFII